jgi:DNA-binding response OmpR family regulator
MKLKLIYIDDSNTNIESLKLILEDEFNVVGASDQSTFPSILKDHSPHAILLDFHMPEMNGFEVYEKIVNDKNYNGCPVLFISGDIQDENRLRAIKLGGMDFFSRSLPPQEIKFRLLSRIKLHLQSAAVLTFDNLCLDKNTFAVTIGTELIDLTLIELRVLSLILRSQPGPISKNQLVKTIWGESSTQNLGKLSVHVSHMNAKLAAWKHEIKMRDDLILISKI